VPSSASGSATQNLVHEPPEAAFAFTVTQLTDLVCQTVRANGALRGVLVRGEMSNVVVHASGRIYFTLKDERSQVASVVFRSDAVRLRFEPENGLEVLVAGDVDVFSARSQYQLVARDVRPLGQGAWWLHFQQVRMGLEAEGLTADARKRALPATPRRIGLVTSPDTAAYHDVLRTLADRWPLVEVVVALAPVQGDDAPPALITALSRLAHADIDVVIIARGGGSAEDLACFNDASLARAVASSPIPVVSAIGHETDVTILDFVADVRAATPSRAAELVAPDRAEVLRDLGRIRSDLEASLRVLFEDMRERARTAHGRLTPEAVLGLVRDLAQRLDVAFDGMRAAIRLSVERAQDRAERAASALNALGPRPTLERGFAVVLDVRGATVSSVATVSRGDRLRVVVRDGEIRVTVEDRKEVKT